MFDRPADSINAVPEALENERVESGEIVSCASPKSSIADGSNAPPNDATTPLDSLLETSFYPELRARALELGLSDLGCAPCGEARGYDLFLERARAGYCAKLTYLTDEPEKRREPSSVLPNAQSIIVVAFAETSLPPASSETSLQEHTESELPPNAARGKIVGYALRRDYHDVLRQKLKALAQFVCNRFPNATTRVAVDTAPLLEKSWGRAAGLGFIGLNSLLVSSQLGSRFFLGEILTTLPFASLVGTDAVDVYFALRAATLRRQQERVVDADAAERQCLACRRCVDACPTSALVGDRTLDSRRCLNYWTIENREEIPPDIAEKLGDRLFGCDECRRVCPYNVQVEALEPQELPLDAVERLDEESFRRLFKKTPVFRATVDGLKRSARSIRKKSQEK